MMMRHKDRRHSSPIINTID